MWEVEVGREKEVKWRRAESVCKGEGGEGRERVGRGRFLGLLVKRLEQDFVHMGKTRASSSVLNINFFLPVLFV